MKTQLLVFDDDAAIGRLVVRVGSAAGLEAVAVTDADAFRRSMQDAPPQIIMLDLQLGQTDGVEQVRFLAERRYAGALVLLSGFSERVLEASVNVAKSLGLNVAAKLAKPIRIEALEQLFDRLKSSLRPLSAGHVLAAIRNDELSLDFQPIVRREPKLLKKLEALVRWDHPTLGRIPPGDFVPLAESDQTAIDALTEWVIGATVDSYLVLRELGVNIPISVNISTRNLHDLSLPDRLARRMEAAGMPPSQLCLEITETAASRDVDRMMDILTRIRLKGMQLSIDDFGTGYSSLKALRQLPYNEIKIDRSFVHDIATSPESYSIVKAIIDLATNMSMSCVAEGVETDETAQLLEKLQVEALQGYLIAPPMPVEAVPSWLAIWARREPDPESRSEQFSPAAGVDRNDVMARAGRMEADSGLFGQPAHAGAAPVNLSPRQMDVMRLLSAGRSVKEMARELDLSVGTVKVHLSLAYSALGARNRVEAVRKAGMFAGL